MEGMPWWGGFGKGSICRENCQSKPALGVKKRKGKEYPQTPGQDAKKRVSVYRGKMPERKRKERSIKLGDNKKV